MGVFVVFAGIEALSLLGTFSVNLILVTFGVGICVDIRTFQMFFYV